MSVNYRNPNFLLPNEVNMATNPDLSVDRHSLYSMEFDGTSYVIIGSTISGTGAATISMWLNTDTISDNNRILSNTDNYNFSVKFDGTGSIKVYGPTEGWGGAVVSGLSVDNQWFHLCLVFDGAGNVTGYKNGILGSTQTTTANRSNLGLAAKVGLAYGTNYNGTMDEVALFNTALTQSQIQALSDSKDSPVNIMAFNPKPIAYYPLGEQARNTGYLSSGSDVSGSEWQFPNQSIQSTVIDFENSGAPAVGQTGDNIELGSTINLGTQNTISFWFKSPSPNPVTNDRFCMIGNQYTSGKYTIFIFDNQILYRVGNNTGGYLSWTITGGGAPLLDDKWHNIIVNRNGASAGLYIDGVDKGAPAGTIVATDNTFIDKIGSTGPLTINYYYNGEMSNVVAWNSDQTSEKDNIYNNGSPATSYTNTPTAWWKLNAANSSYDTATSTWNFTDSTRATSPTYTSAIQTTVATNKISTGNVTAPSMAHTYFSFWFKSSDSSEKNIVLNNLGSLVIGPTRAYIRTHHSGVYKSFAISTLTDGSWHNIIYGFPNEGGSVSLNDMKLWVDGQEIIGVNIGSSTMTGNVSVVQGLYYGGASGSFSAHVPSSLSNYAFFNTDVSGQVSTIWNNGTPGDISTLNPYIWYKLENITIGLNDSGSGGNNGSLTGTFNNETTNVLAPSVNATSTTLPTSALVRSDLQFESPYSNFSLDFDGTSNFINCGVNNSLVSATNFSISGWFYFDASAATGKTFFSYGSSTGPQYGFTAQTFSGGNILFAIANSVSDSGSNLIITNLTTPLTTGQWYNIICTFDGSQTGNTNRAKVYVNGTQAPISGSGSGLIPETTSISTGPFNIGQWDLGGSNRFFNGKIDEVSIFNYTLNDSQINQVYNNGLASDLTSLSPTSWWRLGEDAYFVNNDITIPNQITGGPSGTGSGTQTSMLVADAPGSYGSGSGVNLDIVDRIGEAPGTSPVNIGNSQSYNMIPDDRHSYVPGYTPAKVDNAFSMDFDGINDYFDLGSGFNMFRYNINESYTISLWYKTTSALGDRTLINLGANTYKFFLTSGNGGKISFGAGVSTSNAAVYNWLPTAGAINDGEWHHICIVQDSSSGTVNLTPYVDGSSSGSGGGTAFTVQVNNRIGLGHYGGIPCGLDEVAIFNYALTPKQIKEDIYNASTTGKAADLNNNSNLTAPVAWYRMGD